MFDLDFKKLLFDLLRFWWLFIITVSLSLLVVWAIHRYTVPVYRASMTLLMEDRGSNQSNTDMMQGFGLTPGMSNVDNQIAILSSWKIFNRTINQLDYFLGYYVEGTVKSTELYNSFPFIVYFDSTHVQLLNTPIHINVIDTASYELSFSTEEAYTYNYKARKFGEHVGPTEFSKVYKFGDIAQTPWFSVAIYCKGCTPKGFDYYIKFNNPGSLVNEYRSHFYAAKEEENSSIVNLSVTGTNSAKNIKFLNKLADVFIAYNLEEKNQIATNTIKFIKSQLVKIADSLLYTGTELSEFRTEKKIQSVSSEAEYLFSTLKSLEFELAAKEVTKSYYKYLKDYFSDDNNMKQVMAPAMYQVDNPILSDLINQIISINAERLAAIETYGEALNPGNVEFEKRLDIARRTLIQALESQMMILNESVARLNDKKAKIEGEIKKLPETERRMWGIERKFQLNNEVYTFLLRKLTESQIQKASNTPDHKVLEEARSGGIIYPNKPANRKKAVMIGLVIPVLFLVVRQLLNNKITGKEDVEKLSDKPFLGHILHNDKPDTNVITAHPKSVISETFRRVRTRLDFINQNIKSPVIAVTSSMPGEGKTFCALNTASVFALAGKKTLLVGFDMRKPGLNNILGFKKDDLGISNYLAGKVELDEITKTIDQDNLYIIGSGIIPPNPAELIGSERMKEFIKEIKKRYDIIVLDTPPMGIVSDPYLIARHADSIVFLVRQNYTIKEVLAHTLRNVEEEGITNVGLLLNDITAKKSGYGYRYNYGYGYGYGYGHGYYEE